MNSIYTLPGLSHTSQDSATDKQNPNSNSNGLIPRNAVTYELLTAHSAAKITDLMADAGYPRTEFRAWDVFRLLPVRSEHSSEPGFWFALSMQLLKLICYPLILLLLLGSALLAKATFLLMISQIGYMKGTVAVQRCHKGLHNAGHNNTVELGPEQAVRWVWAVYLAICAPEVICLIRALQRIFFRSIGKPSATQFFVVLIVESLQATGCGLLVFWILVELDAVQSAMLCSAVCLIPTVLCLLSRRPRRLSVVLVAFDIVAIGAQSTALWIWSIWVPIKGLPIWAIPLVLILCSIGSWENYVDRRSIFPCIQKLARFADSLQQVRSKTYVFVAPMKCTIYMACMFGVLSQYTNVNKLMEPHTFASKQLAVTINDPVFEDNSDNSFGIPLHKNVKNPDSSRSFIDTWQFLSDLNKTDPLRRKRQANLPPQLLQVVEIQPTEPFDAIWAFLITSLSSFFCYQCAKFACKVTMQRFSFSLPLNLCSGILVLSLAALCIHRSNDSCYMTQILPPELFWRCPTRILTSMATLFTRSMTWFWLLWWASQIWITIHIWIPQCERLADTDRLFVLPWFNLILLDQYLSLNRRRDDRLKIKTEHVELDGSGYGNNSNAVYESLGSLHTGPKWMTGGSSGQSPHKLSSNADSITKIFACATMWHETRQEMICMLKSIFRLDEDQCARRNAQKYLKVVDPDYYELEAHIMFDDAFEANDYGEPTLNRFVCQLLDVIDIAAGAVHQTCMRIKPPSVYAAPYGGRLVWSMPGRNCLTVHLKDSNKIRVRKRWSQVMYMYFLMGHRLMERVEEVGRKEVIGEHSFVLTLDGDVDFQPKSVQLLVDLMKKNRRLGAACGRIHPRGSGPMLWYQRFEYAIGHWFQKATEHMLGCVLCSPGCFSLFRASALMDDNVLRKYATKAEKAVDYIQYDQGEDRWLCTLLLQRGYRVEYCAAADALTFAPQSFHEFFQQRRRWIPSTLANTVALLHDYKNVVRVNDSISIWYIIYQFSMLMSSILGPGSIFLMVAGAVHVSFGQGLEFSFLLVLFPVSVFVVVCFTCKPDTQILIAQIISALFALLMMAVIVGTALQIKKDGVASPQAIFILWVIGSFFVAACLHPLEFWCIVPGLLYLLAVPCTYMLMSIYSVCNLQVVAWGTRELKTTEDESKQRKGKQINLIENHEEMNEAESSLSVGCGSACRLLCCLQPSNVQDTPQFRRVAHYLATLDQKMERLDRRMGGRRPHSMTHQVLESEPLIEEPEEADMEADTSRLDDRKDDFEIPYQQVLRQRALLSNRWLDNNKCLRHALRQELEPQEEHFWSDLITKYLWPLKRNLNEQERIKNELHHLRNHVAFGFFMANALFILVVFLLQLKKDCLNMEWPIGPKVNRTVPVCDYSVQRIELSEEKYEVRGLQLEPIGFVFLLFFMSMLVIQFVAMLLHRFGTLSHMLASTELFCRRRRRGILNDDEILAEHFVTIAKELQSIRGADDGAGAAMPEADEAEQTISRRRVVRSLAESSLRQPQLQRTETLDAAFKRRFFALNSNQPGLIDDEPIYRRGDSIGKGPSGRLTMRKGTVRALESRRNSIYGTLDKQRAAVADDDDDRVPPRGPARRKLDQVFTRDHNGAEMEGVSRQDSWLEKEGPAIKRSGVVERADQSAADNTHLIRPTQSSHTAHL